MTSTEYVEKYYKVDFERVQKRCDRLNNMMSKIQVGDYLYIKDPWDGAFEQIVTEIIDRTTGMVEVLEKHINRKMIISVNELCTYDEASEYMSSMGENMRDRTEFDKTY